MKQVPPICWLHIYLSIDDPIQFYVKYSNKFREALQVYWLIEPPLFSHLPSSKGKFGVCIKNPRLHHLLFHLVIYQINMQPFAFLAGLFLSVQIPFVNAQIIFKDAGKPAGYNEGFATVGEALFIHPLQTHSLFEYSKIQVREGKRVSAIPTAAFLETMQVTPATCYLVSGQEL